MYIRVINMNMTRLHDIYIGDHVLSQLAKDVDHTQMMVIVDPNTYQFCYPRLKNKLPPHELCKIDAGEEYKTLTTCEKIWDALTKATFDRKSLVINLGGGVIGDMGGFVASTYKRGVDFIHVPTTLLAQVDASIGGKLGIDFQGFKNHIGLFNDPLAVYIDPTFLKTLPRKELRSGFAEVIKHHLIADTDAWAKLYKIKKLSDAPFNKLIEHSVRIKQLIVEQDVKESGPRKALNFGHTIGHAIETLFLQGSIPLLHGEAIAIGMIAESYLSTQKQGLEPSSLAQISQYILHHFSHTPIPKNYYQKIYDLMLNDKKNQAGKILCTLIPDIGSYTVNVPLSKEEIFKSLDYYNECA